MSQFSSLLIENCIRTLKIYNLDQTPLPTSLLHNYYLYNTMNIHGPEKPIKHSEQWKFAMLQVKAGWDAVKYPRIKKNEVSQIA